MLEAPLCEPPYENRLSTLILLEKSGIELPQLYKEGFPHNNCGGFCIKAGISQFLLLLRTNPVSYAYHEQQEELMRKKLGDVSILSQKLKNKRVPLTLKQLRLRTMEESALFPTDEWGGCGCFVDS